MADQRLMVSIEAKDGASKTFVAVGRAATESAKAIESGSKQAAAGTKELETGLKATESASKAAEAAGKSFAVGIGLLGSSFALYSREVVTNQQNVATLGRTYGEASAELQLFAQQIQQTTTFSSEQAVAVENIFGTLSRNFGLQSSQIQQLTQLSADYAATTGLGIEDVAQRLQSAIRGEAEASEALGISMSQTAIDREGLTLSMSNQEAAQFRLNALIEQSGFVQGAAAEKAATATGQTAQLANKVNDAARSFVEMTGPVGQVAGGLGDFGIQAGLAATGIVKIAQGAGQAANAVGGLSTVVGTAGFVAAAAGAYYGAQALARHFDSDFPAALHAAEGATDSLDAAIARMTITLGDAALALRFTNINTGLDQTLAELDRIAFLREQVNTIPQGGRADDATISAYQTELAGLEARYGDVTAASNEAKAAQADLENVLNHASAGAELAQQRALELSEQYNSGKITLAEYAAQLDWITQHYTNYDQAALQAEVATTKSSTAQMRASEIAQSHAQAISDLTEQYGDLGLTVADTDGSFAKLWFTVHAGEIGSRKAAAGLNEIGAAAEIAAGSTGRMALSTRELMLATYDLWVQQRAQQQIFADLDVGVGAYTDDQKKLNASAHETATTLKGDYANSLVTLDTALKTGTSSAHDFGAALQAQQDAAAAFAEQITDAAKAVGLLDSSAEQLSAGGVKSPTLDLAVNTTGAVEAVNDVYRTVVTNTEAIGNQSQGIADWFGSFTIGSDDAISKLQELRNNQQISDKTYRDAITATNSVLADNADIQEDLLRIQAKQAPLVADMVREQAAYIDTLADADAQTQLVALGYMDSAESAKAFALAQLAANAATAGFTEPASKAIAAAAEADPVLKAMLEDMGLISVGADGTVTVTIDGKDTVQSAITDLATAIDGLTTAINILVGEDGAYTTQKAIEAVTGAAGDVPEQVTSTINAIDNATGTIASVKQALLDIDGLTAHTQIDNFVNNVTTNSVNTIYSSSGVGPTAALGNTILPEYATGGTVGDIPRYAGGGTYAMVGEYGPEMVWLNRGEQVTNAGATRSRRETGSRGRSVGVAFYGPVTLQPASTDVEDALRQSAMTGSRR